MPEAPSARPPRDLRGVSHIVKRMVRNAGIRGDDAAAYKTLHTRAASQIRSYLCMILFKLDEPPLPRSEPDVLRLLQLMRRADEQEALVMREQHLAAASAQPALVSGSLA